jgi:membrane-bound serine protease (ClpP class)
MTLATIIFLVIGFILLLVEVFLIPGFGPVGVLGAILMIIGIAIAGYYGGVELAVIYTGIAIGASVPLCILGAWLIPKSKLGKSFILNTSAHRELGFTSISSVLEEFNGKTGVAVTPLRPAGIVRIDNTRIDAIAQGVFIEAGEEIEVVRVDGSRLVVKDFS